jgi:hypothetical protein
MTTTTTKLSMTTTTAMTMSLYSQPTTTAALATTTTMTNYDNDDNNEVQTPSFVDTLMMGGLISTEKKESGEENAEKLHQVQLCASLMFI